MHKYMLAFLFGTAFNVGFDLIVGRFGPTTLNWELAMINGILWCWAMGVHK